MRVILSHVVAFVLIITQSFFVHAGSAGGVGTAVPAKLKFKDPTQFLISFDKFKKLSEKNQLQYILLVNQLIYQLEYMQGNDKSNVTANLRIYFSIFGKASAEDDVFVDQEIIVTPPDAEGFIYSTQIVPASANVNGTVSTQCPPDMGNPSYKKNGATCLFGGYASQYRQKSRGVYKCQAPAEGFKNSCPTTGAKQFQCHGFALDNVGTICVDVEDLCSLTVRCANAIDQKLRDYATGADGKLKISREDYDKYLTSLKDKINTFFQSPRGQGISLHKYCISNYENDINAQAQRPECERIAGIVANFEKLGLESKDPITPAAVEPKCVKDPNCLECVVNEQLKKNPDSRSPNAVSKDYMLLLDLMADHCSAGKEISEADKIKMKANILSSVGYCTEYPVQTERADLKTMTKEKYYELYRQKKSKDMPVYNRLQFDDIFGMHLSTAKKAFCPDKDATNAFERQKQFDQAMQGNRKGDRFPATEEDRFESGWQYCDAEIQRRQGKRMIQGLRQDTANELARRYGGEALTDKGKKFEGRRGTIDYYPLDADAAKLPGGDSNLNHIDWGQTEIHRFRRSTYTKADGDMSASMSFENALRICYDPTARGDLNKEKRGTQ